MSRARTVVFDNEAVQALVDPAHRKHRRVLALVESVAAANERRKGSVRLVVPTAVRVEAGWDRRRPGAAVINRLRVRDLGLDTEAADLAASVAARLGVSVADAHLAAGITRTPGPHAVLTSDADDVRRIEAHLGTEVNPVVI